MTFARWELATSLILSALLVGGALWGVGSVAVHDLLLSWERSGHNAGLLHAGLLMAVASLWLATQVQIGPVARSRGDLQWRDEAPARTSAAARYLLWSACIAVVIAAPLVLAPLAGQVGVAWVAAAFVAGLLALSAIAWAGEYADARDWLVAGARGFALTAFAMVALSAGDRILALALGLAAAVVVIWGSWRRRVTGPGDAPPRWLLIRAAEQRWAMRASVVLLDGSVARQTKERWGGRPVGFPRNVPTLAGPEATRAATLLVRQIAVVGVATASTLYLAHRLVGTWSAAGAMAVVVIVMGALATATGAPGDRWADAPALRRTYAEMSTWQVLLPPIVCLLVVAGAAIAVLRPDPLAALVPTLLAPALVVRRHRARASILDGLVSSPMGAVPVGQANRLVAGWDLVVLATLLLALV